ncbi:hypothetical protein FSST1_007117 [Fusarium sambucinum]
MLINNPDYPNGSADITTQPAQHSNNANLSTELTEDSENENENLGKLSTGKATQICPDIRALGMIKRVVGVSRRTCLRPQKIPDLPRGHQWDGVRPIEEIRHIYDFKFDAEPSPNRSHAPGTSTVFPGITLFGIPSLTKSLSLQCDVPHSQQMPTASRQPQVET